MFSAQQFLGYNGANCLARSRDQIALKNLTDLGSANVFTAYKLNTYYPDGARDGVNYIISKLQKGQPVIVGVDNKAGAPKANPDNTSDHFIVIVGAGVDRNGNYLKIFDNASTSSAGGANPYNRLYYNPTSGAITGKSASGYARQPGRYNYIITHTRKNK